MKSVFLSWVCGAMLGLAVAAPAGAQTPTPAPPAQQAEEPIAPCAEPQVLPPADSPLLYRCATVWVHPNNETLLDPQTYGFYVKTKASSLDGTRWVPYKQDAVLADGLGLWKTGFLDNYWIEEIDEPYANGVKGIHVIFHLVERPRLKGVEYVGSKKVDVSKIEDAMKEKGISLNVDSFLEQSSVRKVQGVISELYGEKGYQAATVTPEIVPIDGDVKLVRIVFHINQGPEVKIREIAWDGNSAFSDGALTGQLKDNKPHSWLSWLTQSGTYQEAKFADDAQMVIEYYQNHGYTRAFVGTPQIETIEDSRDGKTRWIRLRIPVEEGRKYRIGTVTVAGNVALKTEPLVAMLKVHEGDLYSRKKLVKGLEEIKKIYGQFGYWEANPFPDFCFRGTDCETGKPLAEGPLPDIVDIKVDVNEGKQFFVNRITFYGNTTTHDAVIRREMRVFETHPFNSEALKDSVKRLNQLGYFKPIEGKPEEIEVLPTPGTDNKVDIKLHVEEQNRNQITFGAGVSQFEGVFGQLGYQTSNFLGRGETLGISLQKGSQARNYQVSFSEPYVFDRPITIGGDIYARQYIFLTQYTQDDNGGDAVVSMSLGGYRRLSMGYSYSNISIHDIGPAYFGLLSDVKYSISKVTPAFIYNTVNQPIFPSSGVRYTASVSVAGFGGTAQFVTTSLEGIWYLPITPRTSLGLRLQGQVSDPYGRSTALPISERAYLGGEYSIRGFDIRSIGPRDALSGVVLGGNKTLLFNAEYYFDLFGPVRFLLFYDAGEVRDLGAPFVLKDAITEIVPAPRDLLTDFSGGILTYPGAPTATTKVIGHASAIKTSTGAELRFFMPVLNVPFRLIAAYNPQRYGVLNNQLRLTGKFTFRFAVGTTF